MSVNLLAGYDVWTFGLELDVLDLGRTWHKLSIYVMLSASSGNQMTVL